MIAFIGIPATSASLFMVAGVLIGYLLWNRDRRADQRALKIAESKAQQAREVARLRKQAFIELRDRQQAGDGARTAEATSPPDHAETVTGGGPVTDNVRGEELRVLQECRQQIQQLGEIRDRLATANHELTCQRDDLADQLKRSETQRTTVAADLNTTQQNLETTQQEFETTQQELQTLQASQAETAAARLAAEATCGEQAVELERLQAVCTAGEAAQQQWRDSLTATEEELREATVECERLQNEFERLQETFDKTNQECADVRNINAQLQAALEEQTAEFDELTQQLAGKEQLEQTLQAAEGTIERMQGELEAAHEENRSFLSELETLRPLPARLQQRESDVARLDREVQRLHTEELEPLTARHAQASEALQSAEQEIRQLVAERQQDQEARNDLQGRTQQLEEERHVLHRGNETLKRRLGELTAVVGQIRQELNEAERRSQEADAAHAETRKESAQQATRITALQRELEQAAAYREQVQVFEAKVRRLTESLRGVGERPEEGPVTLPFGVPGARPADQTSRSEATRNRAA